MEISKVVQQLWVHFRRSDWNSVFHAYIYALELGPYTRPVNDCRFAGCEKRRPLLPNRPMPVILLLYKAYGATDMGVEGMALFFLHHKCNDFCKDLPRPQLNDFLQNPRIPRQQIVACIQALQQVSSATTYTFELQLTEEVQTVIIEQFRSYFTSVLFWELIYCTLHEKSQRSSSVYMYT